jgi:serine/threonine-protein kinase
LCPIGTGGMASVWVARLLGKHGFEKLVAIKTILPRFARDPHFQHMFLDEARIASQIQHPNVAQILDLGDHDDILFLAMEWVEGEALSALARAVQESGRPFPPNIAARILIDVCAGLHAAHELCDRDGKPLGIVHRDVSPHNVLVGAQGVSKVIDFGIAKARDRAAGDTESGSFKGKVKYMAPEQALSPRSIDRRADVWAAGAIFYYVLSGRSPYEGENDIATISRLASKSSPLPLPSHVPAPIRAIATRALAWSADQRFATADEMRFALERAMVEAGITATPGDVAAFCARHLAEHSNARKQAVALALKEADERSRVVLRDESAPGGRSMPRRVQYNSSSPTEVFTSLPGTTGEPGAETSATLGTGATMTTSQVSALVRKRRLGRVAGVASTAVAVAAAVAVALAVRRHEPWAAAEPPAPPKESAAHPTAATIPPVASAAAPLASTSVSDDATAVAGRPAAPAPPGVAVPTQGTAPASSVRPTTRHPSASTPPAPPPAQKRDSPAPAPTVKHRAEYGF